MSPTTSPMTSSDEHGGLRRQALLIALLAAAGDGLLFALAVRAAPASAAAAPAVLLWGAGAVVVAADLLLALPARTAGWVAVVHGVVRCATAVLLWQLTGVRDLGTGNSTGLAVAGYRAGAWTVGWRSWAALAALALGMTGAQVVELAGRVPTAGAAVTTVANTLLPWLMGRYTTGRAGHIEQVERAADERRRRAVAEVERARAEERGAIARDLHDTISHHVSAIGVHAAAGRLALAAAGARTGSDDHRPALASLQHVEGASGAAMADLRRMLGLLARGADRGDDGARQPGLADVEALLEGSRRAGLRLALEAPGLDPAALPGSTQLAAYRIVQEVLTNAQRHGDGSLHLLLRQDDAALTVIARNPVAPAGARRGAAGSGRGIAGMAHRAQLFGGTATAGPSDDGGSWCTRVDLPVEAP